MFIPFEQRLKHSFFLLFTYIWNLIEELYNYKELYFNPSLESGRGGGGAVHDLIIISPAPLSTSLWGFSHSNLNLRAGQTILQFHYGGGGRGGYDERRKWKSSLLGCGRCETYLLLLTFRKGIRHMQRIHKKREYRQEGWEGIQGRTYHLLLNNKKIGDGSQYHPNFYP
jgi:hypothetical protein